MGAGRHRAQTASGPPHCAILNRQVLFGCVQFGGRRDGAARWAQLTGSARSLSVAEARRWERADAIF
jgi:hypothetical protein